MTSKRAAVVMEQTLGHVTHSRNLREVAGGYAGLETTWLPIPFEIHGPARLVPMLWSNWSVRASWRARRALDRALIAQPHDALLFHTQVTALFSVGLMRRFPTVVSLDATPVNYDTVGRYYGHQAAGNGPLDRQKYRMNRRVFHAAAGLVTWSDWARRSLDLDYGVDPARVRVIAPGAAPAYFGIGERRSALSEATGGRPVRLLFVGGDFRRKGGPLLLECMRGELADRCELHLVTQESVPPGRNVYVHSGLRPNSPELLRLFADADIFVLPTMAECLAIALMEATASALPVITTDVAALGEAVRPGESGLLIRPGDVSSLRRAIHTLVDDSQLRLRMGRSGFELARQKFDSRCNGRSLLDLVAEVAETGRGTRRAA